MPTGSVSGERVPVGFRVRWERRRQDRGDTNTSNMCRENVFTLFEDLTCGRIDDIEDQLPYCCGGLCGSSHVCTPMGVQQQLDVAQQMYDYVKPIFGRTKTTRGGRHGGTVGPSIKSTDPGRHDRVLRRVQRETWHSSVPATFPSLKFHECARHHTVQSCFQTTNILLCDRVVVSSTQETEIDGRPVHHLTQSMLGTRRLTICRCIMICPRKLLDSYLTNYYGRNIYILVPNPATLRWVTVSRANFNVPDVTQAISGVDYCPHNVPPRNHHVFRRFTTSVPTLSWTR